MAAPACASIIERPARTVSSRMPLADAAGVRSSSTLCTSSRVIVIRPR